MLNRLPGKTILEVGCGEGPNFVNIQKKYEKYGIDYSKTFIAVARKKVRGVHFSCQDATKLEFAADSFDVVFCRDLLHHVDNRAQVVKEMFRVCKPGGRVVLIESNGMNPLCQVFARVQPAEHDVRYITPAYVGKLLRGYDINAWRFAEPLAWWKFAFHYRFGFPSLGRVRLVQSLCGCMDGFFALILPKKLWGYIIIEINK